MAARVIVSTLSLGSLLVDHSSKKLQFANAKGFATTILPHKHGLKQELQRRRSESDARIGHQFSMSGNGQHNTFSQVQRPVEVIDLCDSPCDSQSQESKRVKQESKNCEDNWSAFFRDNPLDSVKSNMLTPIMMRNDSSFNLERRETAETTVGDYVHGKRKSRLCSEGSRGISEESRLVSEELVSEGNYIEPPEDLVYSGRNKGRNSVFSLPETNETNSYPGSTGYSLPGSRSYSPSVSSAQLPSSISGPSISGFGAEGFLSDEDLYVNYSRFSGVPEFSDAAPEFSVTTAVPDFSASVVPECTSAAAVPEFSSAAPPATVELSQQSLASSQQPMLSDSAPANSFSQAALDPATKPVLDPLKPTLDPVTRASSVLLHNRSEQVPASCGSNFNSCRSNTHLSSQTATSSASITPDNGHFTGGTSSALTPQKFWSNAATVNPNLGPNNPNLGLNNLGNFHKSLSNNPTAGREEDNRPRRVIFCPFLKREDLGSPSISQVRLVNQDSPLLKNPYENHPKLLMNQNGGNSSGLISSSSNQNGQYSYSNNQDEKKRREQEEWEYWQNLRRQMPDEVATPKHLAGFGKKASAKSGKPACKKLTVKERDERFSKIMTNINYSVKTIKEKDIKDLELNGVLGINEQLEEILNRLVLAEGVVEGRPCMDIKDIENLSALKNLELWRTELLLRPTTTGSDGSMQSAIGNSVMSEFSDFFNLLEPEGEQTPDPSSESGNSTEKLESAGNSEAIIELNSTRKVPNFSAIIEPKNVAKITDVENIIRSATGAKHFNGSQHFKPRQFPLALTEVLENGASATESDFASSSTQALSTSETADSTHDPTTSGTQTAATFSNPASSNPRLMSTADRLSTLKWARVHLIRALMYVDFLLRHHKRVSLNFHNEQNMQSSSLQNNGHKLERLTALDTHPHVRYNTEQENVLNTYVERYVAERSQRRNRIVKAENDRLENSENEKEAEEEIINSLLNVFLFTNQRKSHVDPLSQKTVHEWFTNPPPSDLKKIWTPDQNDPDRVRRIVQNPALQISNTLIFLKKALSNTQKELQNVNIENAAVIFEDNKRLEMLENWSGESWGISGTSAESQQKRSSSQEFSKENITTINQHLLYLSANIDEVRKHITYAVTGQNISTSDNVPSNFNQHRITKTVAETFISYLETITGKEGRAQLHIVRDYLESFRQQFTREIDGLETHRETDCATFVVSEAESREKQAFERQKQTILSRDPRAVMLDPKEAMKLAEKEAVLAENERKKIAVHEYWCTRRRLKVEKPSLKKRTLGFAAAGPVGFQVLMQPFSQFSSGGGNGGDQNSNVGQPQIVEAEVLSVNQQHVATINQQPFVTNQQRVAAINQQPVLSENVCNANITQNGIGGGNDNHDGRTQSNHQGAPGTGMVTVTANPGQQTHTQQASRQQQNLTLPELCAIIDNHKQQQEKANREKSVQRLNENLQAKSQEQQLIAQGMQQCAQERHKRPLSRQELEIIQQAKTEHEQKMSQRQAERGRMQAIQTSMAGQKPVVQVSNTHVQASNTVQQQQQTSAQAFMHQQQQASVQPSMQTVQQHQMSQQQMSQQQMSQQKQTTQRRLNSNQKKLEALQQELQDQQRTLDQQRHLALQQGQSSAGQSSTQDASLLASQQQLALFEQQQMNKNWLSRQYAPPPSVPGTAPPPSVPGTAAPDSSLSAQQVQQQQLSQQQQQQQLSGSNFSTQQQQQQQATQVSVGQQQLPQLAGYTQEQLQLAGYTQEQFPFYQMALQVQLARYAQEHGYTQWQQPGIVSQMWQQMSGLTQAQQQVAGLTQAQQQSIPDIMQQQQGNIPPFANQQGLLYQQGLIQQQEQQGLIQQQEQPAELRKQPSAMQQQPLVQQQQPPVQQQQPLVQQQQQPLVQQQQQPPVQQQQQPLVQQQQPLVQQQQQPLVQQQQQPLVQQQQPLVQQQQQPLVQQQQQSAINADSNVMHSIAANQRSYQQQNTQQQTNKRPIVGIASPPETFSKAPKKSTTSTESSQGSSPWRIRKLVSPVQTAKTAVARGVANVANVVQAAKTAVRSAVSTKPRQKGRQIITTVSADSVRVSSRASFSGSSTGATSSTSATEELDMLGLQPLQAQPLQPQAQSQHDEMDLGPLQAQPQSHHRGMWHSLSV